MTKSDPSPSEDLRITVKEPALRRFKGRDHLAALRRELTAAYDEVVREQGPERSVPSRAASRAVPDVLAGVELIRDRADRRRAAAFA